MARAEVRGALTGHLITPVARPQEHPFALRPRQSDTGAQALAQVLTSERPDVIARGLH
jgi:hypothetical protein